MITCRKPLRTRMWYFKQKAIPKVKNATRLLLIIVFVVLFYIVLNNFIL